MNRDWRLEIKQSPISISLVGAKFFTDNYLGKGCKWLKN